MKAEAAAAVARLPTCMEAEAADVEVKVVAANEEAEDAVSVADVEAKTAAATADLEAAEAEAAVAMLGRLNTHVFA